MNRLQAKATRMIEDERVIVTRFDFEAGAKTGWHRHAFDCVITAITDCQMLLEEAVGTSREVTVPAGTAYRREEGVEHNLINGGATPMSFVEVELK